MPTLLYEVPQTTEKMSVQIAALQNVPLDAGVDLLHLVVSERSVSPELGEPPTLRLSLTLDPAPRVGDEPTFADLFPTEADQQSALSNLFTAQIEGARRLPCVDLTYATGGGRTNPDGSGDEGDA